MNAVDFARPSYEELNRELRNFEEIASRLIARPGSIPSLARTDVFGQTLPLNGIVGGDHLIYLDFKKRYDLDARIRVAAESGQHLVAENLERCRHLAGIALLDVSGHRITDALLAAMFHQAFLLGALYELDMCGHITGRLFENLNTRFYGSSHVNKFISALYGEISEDAQFRFVSAGHPAPVVFSAAHQRFMEVNVDRYAVSSPLGMRPSQHVVDWRFSDTVLGFKEEYELNEWILMGDGDILLLFTDGLVEHARAEERYFPHHFEDAIRRAKDLPASDLVKATLDDLQTFADPTDDVSLVAIKRL